MKTLLGFVALVLYTLSMLAWGEAYAAQPAPQHCTTGTVASTPAAK
jgi:hypothetical protein